MRRGQGTLEYIGLIGALALLGLAAAVVAVYPTLPARLGGAITGAMTGLRGAPEPSPATRAYVDRALGADLSGHAPTLGDAERRLTAEIGAQAARALIVSEALRRHLPPVRPIRLEPLADPVLAEARPDLDGVGPAVDAGVWSIEEERGAPTVVVVDRATEERWRAALVPSPAERIATGAPRVLATAARIAQPGIASAVMIFDGVTAGTAPRPARGAPPGSREDDLIVCRPIWRTNHATSAWRNLHPFPATRLELDRRRPALDVRVIRHGRLVSRTVLWHAGTRC